MVLQLLLTLSLGTCPCEAVELSFSCLRQPETPESLEQRREEGLWGKG